MDTEHPERQFEPTARRRQRLREAGLVPFSPDLAWALGLLSASLLAWTMKGKTSTVIGALHAYFVGLQTPTAYADPWQGAGALFWPLVHTGILLMAAVFLVTLLAGWLQTGFLFTWPKPLHPGGEQTRRRRKSFPSGWWVRGLLGFVKLGIALTVGWLVIRSHTGRSTNVWAQPPEGILDSWLSPLMDLTIKLAVVFLAFGLLDYWHRRHQHRQLLRLSAPEYREELRIEEGEPLARERRQRWYQEFFSSRNKESGQQHPSQSATGKEMND